MKEYIYIICYYHGFSANGEGEDPAFQHTRVFADSDTDAYEKGGRWADEHMAEFAGKFINDYVVEIST